MFTAHGILDAKESEHCSDIANEVLVEGSCTKLKTYRGTDVGDAPVLVVALHGDAPFNNPSYQYEFAERIAAEAGNVISIGLLRPGYTDGQDRQSDGIRRLTVGDNYDTPRILQIANAIAHLKKHYNASKVILAGHSGGSAITAKIIAIYPNLVDHAFIVSCPCNINDWRADMFETSDYDGFKGDIDVESPDALIANIPPETGITIFIGDSDPVTRKYLSDNYVNALSRAGKKADYHIIEGNHAIFLNDMVIRAVLEKAKAYSAQE